MSQYPSPYPPAPYAQPPIDFSTYQPAGDLLGPARRAGTLVIVLGALVAMLGVCDLGRALFVGADEIAQQQAQLNSMGLPQSPLDPKMIRVTAGVCAGLTLLVGLALAVDGVYVRRGSSIATTLGLVMVGALGLLVCLFILLFAVGAFMAPPLAAVSCVMTVPLGLLIWAFVWLLAAARQGPRLAAAQQQYAAQYYHLQQQQHVYAQPGGYGAPYAPQGYGYPTPPPQQSPQPQQGQDPPGGPGARDSTPAPSQNQGDPNRPRQRDPDETPPAI